MGQGRQAGEQAERVAVGAGFQRRCQVPLAA
jgi:hypothetical protein